MTDADAAALHNAPDVATVTPAATSTASVGTDTTTFLSATIIGTTDIWSETNTRDIQAGSFFDAAQFREVARVVVLGPSVATTLFGAPRAALGQTVWINHRAFQVIGVLRRHQPRHSGAVPHRVHRPGRPRGLITGGYPAYRAAQLRPIEALRYS